MDFSKYLISKKIDPEKFRSKEPETYRSFNTLFLQMHPDSFTAQKLFLINRIRRKYLLEEKPEEATAQQPKKVKPRMVVKAKPK